MIPNAPIGLWPGLEFEGESIDTIQVPPTTRFPHD